MFLCSVWPLARKRHIYIMYAHEHAYAISSCRGMDIHTHIQYQAVDVHIPGLMHEQANSSGLLLHNNIIMCMFATYDPPPHSYCVRLHVNPNTNEIQRQQLNDRAVEST